MAVLALALSLSLSGVVLCDRLGDALSVLAALQVAGDEAAEAERRRINVATGRPNACVAVRRAKVVAATVVGVGAVRRVGSPEVEVGVLSGFVWDVGPQAVLVFRRVGFLL